MTSKPQIVRTLRALRGASRNYRAAKKTVALVPTMGALHAGHLTLVRRARRIADRVIVSIFVNPAQFAPHEDFASYPRRFKNDIAALAGEKVDLVWAPSAAVMYPDGFATQVTPQGPAAVGLEDAFRPHFFGGVATVVTKLLLQCLPDVALFGEKDFQQLQVIRALARDLDIPVKIVGVPIVREKDGLALSSRNLYLSPRERSVAPTLYAVLTACAKKIRKTGAIEPALAEGRITLTRAGFAVDYLEARDAETLKRVASLSGGRLRLLAAATLGKTRLIDNIAV
ncbi:MAG TPA: pantoate--beta-alanine ligase [Xanthobacteraceae bacterium]|nr:pantoate--beta-alanine ligase [Xanthobacteraceae bacterium]